MITMLFRFISLFLIVAALMLLGADAIGTLQAGGQVKMRSLLDVVTLFAPGSGISGEGAFGAISGIPAWALLGGIGLVLAFLFRHRAGDEDYES